MPPLIVLKKSALPVAVGRGALAGGGGECGGGGGGLSSRARFSPTMLDAWREPRGRPTLEEEVDFTPPKLSETALKVGS